MMELYPANTVIILNEGGQHQGQEVEIITLTFLHLYLIELCLSETYFRYKSQMPRKKLCYYSTF